jgi:hypothetical protein
VIPWLAVRDEVAGVLSAVSGDQMARARTMLGQGGPRWFCSGQARGTGQFGGTLFEQSALLLLDALILDLTARDPQAHSAMQARHANLQ